MPPKPHKTKTGYRIQVEKMTKRLREENASDGKEEYNIHCAIIDLLRRTSLPGIVFWHTDQGGKKTPAQAARSKAMGLLPGVHDIILSMPNKSMMYMEVKSRNGRVSKEQSAFGDAMRSHGHYVCVVKSLDEAIRHLSNVGAIKSLRVAA
jgi:hypothetical protein